MPRVATQRVATQCRVLQHGVFPPQKEAKAFLGELFEDIAFLVHVRQGAHVDVLRRLDEVSARAAACAPHPGPPVGTRTRTRTRTRAGQGRACKRHGRRMHAARAAFSRGSAEPSVHLAPLGMQGRLGACVHEQAHIPRLVRMALGSRARGVLTERCQRPLGTTEHQLARGCLQE